MTALRVLIVEDEVIIASDLSYTLQSMGYSVTGTVRSGEAALESVAKAPPDLVVMDINLDGKLDGIETADAIHKTRDIPVIYLTAYADKPLLERAKITGPYGYLITPYDERELRSVVEMAWYKHSLDKKIRESEDKFRALTENTPDILFSMDMGGVVTYISPQVNKYGFLEDEVLGKKLRRFVHPADADRVERTMTNEMEKGAQFIAEFRILDKWGAIFWFEVRCFLRIDISGNPVGIYGILRDVSVRKNAQDAMNIANKKLNLLNQNTRHDILNTITGLLGCVDMAKATQSAAEKDQLLDDIKHLTRVIQNQITFTREYQEVGVREPQWQNINAIIDTVKASFTKSGIAITAGFDTIEIYADPLLEKVFYNLIDNAIRHGGTITRITIEASVRDNDLVLVFRDDGVGIENNQKPEIFKRGVGKNTGMGLFLTAEILEITGIRIEEKGIYGKGACFEIRIPNGTWRYCRE
jgi:PAS domain S-box-containing protein